MEKRASIGLDARAPRARTAKAAGFSLVEVCLAIGIVAFGLLAVIGLLPAGTDIFRQSIQTTVASQILQQAISEANETDFDQLIKDSAGSAIPAGTTGVKAIRYFDEQGKELAQPALAVYHVNTRVQSATDSPATPAFTNLNLATVTVQVAHNPGGRALANETDATLSNLWSGAYAGETTRVVPIFTASSLVSRQ